MTVVGVDVGGTNILAALVGTGSEVVGRAKATTPGGGPEEVLDVVCELVGEVAEEPAAVGVGIPGPVTDGVVRFAPNLVGWAEPVPAGQILSARLGVPVVVDNDATVGAVGEWVAGAGAGASFLLGVWLGTGVGGGLVLGGRAYRGAFGGAGELGHVVILKGGALCGCGRRGCVEAYAGRASMERMVETAIGAGEHTALHEIMAERGKGRLTAGVWARALAAEDPLATRIIDEAVQALGVGVASVINLLDLDTVVVGGGLAEKLGQPLVDRIADAARPYLLVADAERRFIVAALGDDAGVVGAAALARDLVRH
ncbi:MAG: ROK family protein [Egibacteraceae bacterium]